MKQFTGFPAKMQFTPLPNPFFSVLLPQINDIAELKTTLYILGALYQKRGYPRFIAFGELVSNRSLMSTLGEGAKPPDEVLRQALGMATKRGTILHMALDRDGISEDIYFINSDQDRQIITKIQNGELSLAGLKVGRHTCIETGEQPDIFTLYEQNIGMLTPMIADELREAEKLYPASWIQDAIKEAVNQSIHKWSYISAMLERWSSEGKRSGAYRRDSKKTGPDKYIKQKYGHMVRR